MDFQVLAVAPIGTKERDVPRLLRFLSDVFYLKQLPGEDSFKEGGACFLRTRSLTEARAAGKRLQMLGADFRIIHPDGHVVAEGHGKWRKRPNMGRAVTGPMPRPRQKPRPEPPARIRVVDPEEMAMPPGARVGSPDATRPEPSAPSPALANSRKPRETSERFSPMLSKETRDLRTPDHAVSATISSELEFDENDPAWSPFVEAMKVDEAVFKEDTRDISERVQQVRQEAPAPAAQDDAVGEESEPGLQLNLDDSVEWIGFILSSDDIPSAMEAEPEEAEVQADDRTGLLFDVDLDLDSREFGKETREIPEAPPIPVAPPPDPKPVPDEVDLSGCFLEDDEELTEEVPLDESVDFGTGELLMLDGSAPERQHPTGETDFLPPSLGLEHDLESLDLGDQDESMGLQSVELNLDDLDDDEP